VNPQFSSGEGTLKLERILAPVLLFTAAAWPASIGTAGMATYLSYDGYTGKNDLTQPIFYATPDPAVYGKGPYPVAIWIPGTFELSYDPLSLLFVTQMTSRGFLAASVQYANQELWQNCSAYTTRASAIFSTASTTSAITAICALPGASCSKGIVTSGISQGGIIAILARNYTPQVKATYAMSAGSVNQLGFNLTSCMAKPNTTLSANRLVIVNGAEDPSFGSQSSIQGASGVTCPAGSTQCWSADGSGAGWYLVQNSQVTGGQAGHCYIDKDDGCNDNFDPNWLPPATSNWSLKPNLDWLATFGTKRVFSSTGN
jgi:dienelactone hydrolase